jgi:uncharacterized protein YndB with AHSA1/START domain/catechol 2,3-dioxygenase-like lactoylglutathione lyase family enzyme
VIEGLSHITLVVENLDRTAELLRRVFDAREVFSSGGSMFSISREKFFVVGGVWIAIMEGKKLTERSYRHVAFKVPETELDNYVERVRMLGLELKSPRPRVEGEGRSLYFYDYDNHLFELHTGTLEQRLVRYARHAPADAEIVSTRVFDAPREVVFRAFTDPTLLAQWWGPRGFTNTFHEFDPRPGGAWRFVMHGPDGTHYPMTKEFVEVVSPERIVLQHIQAMHMFRMAMVLADEAGGTRVTWRTRFESAEEAENVRGFWAVANEENFDRLQSLLADRSRPPNE